MTTIVTPTHHLWHWFLITKVNNSNYNRFFTSNSKLMIHETWTPHNNWNMLLYWALPKLQNSQLLPHHWHWCWFYQIWQIFRQTLHQTYQSTCLWHTLENVPYPPSDTLMQLKCQQIIITVWIIIQKNYPQSNIYSEL